MRGFSMNNVNSYRNTYSQTLFSKPSMSNFSVLDSKTSKTMSRYGLGFNEMPSKIKRTMTDDELKQAMVEQAQKDAANGIFGGNEYYAIENAYVRVAAPDRKGIVGNLMNTMFGSGLPSFVNVMHPSGSPLSGSVIASYSNTGAWEAIMTREEATRGTEIVSIYNEAWKQARNGNDGNSAENDNEFINRRSIFNKMA